MFQDHEDTFFSLLSVYYRQKFFDKAQAPKVTALVKKCEKLSYSTANGVLSNYTFRELKGMFSFVSDLGYQLFPLQGYVDIIFLEKNFVFMEQIVLPRLQK